MTEKIIPALRDTLSKYATSGEAYQDLGWRYFKELIAAQAPELSTQLEQGKAQLEGDAGYFVLKNLGFEKEEKSVAELFAIAVASYFGEPTKTDQKDGRIAWPIKFDASSTQKNKTFSQTMGEAEFHTDTQYFENPERYFGLFCIVSDGEGKGTNELVSGKDIITYIEKHHGKEVVVELRKPYPFRTPSVFTKGGTDSDIEVVWKPILSESGDMRYRLDTIQKALELPQVSISDSQTQALEAFVDAVRHVQRVRHHLVPGEAIFVNNHTLLHARTFFDNPERFLYRVRVIPSNE